MCVDMVCNFASSEPVGPDSVNLVCGFDGMAFLCAELRQQ